MPVDYTSLFEVTGQFVKLDTFLVLLGERDAAFADASGAGTFTSLDRFHKDLTALLNDSPDERLRGELLDALSAWKAAALGWRAEARAAHDRFLLERVAPEIASAATDLPRTLADLVAAMARDAQSVTKNTVGVSAPSADAANTGTGQVALSVQALLADGTVGPDERACGQSFALTCVADASRDGRTPGDERFELAGDLSGLFSVPVVAATFGSTLDPAGRNRVLDGAFASASGGAFTHWPATSGASLFSRDTTTAVVGSGALLVSGSGALAGRLAQQLSALDPPLLPHGTYVLAANTYASGISAGSVSLRLAGTGYTSAVLSLDASSASGAWVADHLFATLPKTLPADLALEVLASADFAGAARLDNVALAEAVEIEVAGLRLGVFQGGADWQAGPIPDRVTFTTTSDDAGVFQTAFRDAYGVALPSVASGATIPDTLAT